MSSMATQDIAVHRGEPYPLGASWDGEGVNYAVYSENATRVMKSLSLRSSMWGCVGS